MVIKIIFLFHCNYYTYYERRFKILILEQAESVYILLHDNYFCYTLYLYYIIRTEVYSMLNNIIFIIYPDRRAGTIDAFYKIISRTIITITIRYNIIAITTHAHAVPSRVCIYTLNRGNIRRVQKIVYTRAVQ